MKNPTVEVRKKDSNVVYLSIGLWELVMLRIYEGSWVPTEEIEIFVDGTKVDKPSELEDDDPE